LLSQCRAHDPEVALTKPSSVKVCSLESEDFVIPKSQRDALAECVEKVVLAVAASVRAGVPRLAAFNLKLATEPHAASLICAWSVRHQAPREPQRCISNRVPNANVHANQGLTARRTDNAKVWFDETN
jgi:hypothetical protein